MGGHAAHGKRDDDLSGREHIPDHARPSLARAIKVVAIWLPLWLGPVALLFLFLGGDNIFTRLSVFFSEVAVFSFGGAYAVLAYVAQQAVETYHWLSSRRDADRPRHGRDHTRPAHHGGAICRLPCRLSDARRRCRR